MASHDLPTASLAGMLILGPSGKVWRSQVSYRDFKADSNAPSLFTIIAKGRLSSSWDAIENEEWQQTQRRKRARPTMLDQSQTVR